MIAKVIVHGRTRGDAIKIMERALNEFIIEGEDIKTTIPLHKRILADNYFRTGNIDTQFINKRLPIYAQEPRKLSLREKLNLKTMLSENLTTVFDAGANDFEV